MAISSELSLVGVCIGSGGRFGILGSVLEAPPILFPHALQGLDKSQ